MFIEVLMVLIEGGTNLLFFLFILLVVSFFLFSVIELEPALICLDIGDDINVCPIDILESPSVLVNSHSHGFIDSSDLYSVSRSHIIDQIFVSTQVNCLRSLSFWHRLWGLLDLHVLLI